MCTFCSCNRQSRWLMRDMKLHIQCYHRSKCQFNYIQILSVTINSKFKGKWIALLYYWILTLILDQATSGTCSQWGYQHRIDCHQYHRGWEAKLDFRMHSHKRQLQTYHKRIRKRWCTWSHQCIYDQSQFRSSQNLAKRSLSLTIINEYWNRLSYYSWLLVSVCMIRSLTH